MSAEVSETVKKTPNKPSEYKTAKELSENLEAKTKEAEEEALKQRDQSRSPASQSPTCNSTSNSNLIHVYRVHGNRYLEIEVYVSTMKIKSGKLELEQYLQRLGCLFSYQTLDLELDIEKLWNDGKIYFAKTLRDVPFKNLQQLKDQIKSKPIPSNAIQATTIPSK